MSLLHKQNSMRSSSVKMAIPVTTGGRTMLHKSCWPSFFFFFLIGRGGGNSDVQLPYKGRAAEAIDKAAASPVGERGQHFS